MQPSASPGPSPTSDPPATANPHLPPPLAPNLRSQLAHACEQARAAAAPGFEEPGGGAQRPPASFYLRRIWADSLHMRASRPDSCSRDPTPSLMRMCVSPVSCGSTQERLSDAQASAHITWAQAPGLQQDSIAEGQCR